MIGTRYGVGATVLLVYNSTTIGTVYSNSASPTTITGCWVEVNNATFTDTLTPALTKKYESTSYYASSSSSHDTAA